jgi:hypothetical protein
MKSFTLALAALVLAGCSSIGHEVASGINNSQLKNTLGKQYSQVIYERPDFGKLVGRETLPNGDTVMKHVGEFGSATNNVGGIYGTQEQQARVIYFRVDKKGVVKDWATEFYKAGKSTCWVGICGGEKKEQVPTEELDRIVKTSNGQPLQAWRSGKQ